SLLVLLSFPTRRSSDLLRSVFDSATLTADGFRVEIPRAGGYHRRCHFDSPVDRRESGRKSAQTFREALRGLAVETGQWRFARYGDRKSTRLNSSHEWIS